MSDSTQFEEQYRFANNPRAHNLFQKYRSMVAEQDVDAALADIAEGTDKLITAVETAAKRQGALNALVQLKTDYMTEWVGTNAAGALKKNPRSWGEMVDVSIAALQHQTEAPAQPHHSNDTKGKV